MKVLLILKAYMAAGLTDLFGDVPYYTAFNGTEGSYTSIRQSRKYLYE
jgi:hypothetical protein